MTKIPRAFRVAERIREIVATQLIRMADPRLGLISITMVRLSSDLREANVYWTVSGGREREPEVTEGLSSIVGRLKGIVGKELGIRFAPNLRFFYDDTMDTQDQVNALLERVKEKEEISKAEENE
jgi:ribosome-binding factor A